MSLLRSLIVALTVQQFSLAVATANGDNSEWPGYYKCDDLVPPLCDDSLSITTGYVETIDDLKVKFWRYTPSKLNPRKFPIIVANGGPGLPHNFAEHTRNLACDGREVVLYDQGGTGESGLPKGTTATEDYPELLTLKYYAETELPALVEELNFPKYHVLASSWGTMIALQFAVTAALDLQQSLESLILNAPIPDNRKFVQYQWDPVSGSVGTLPTYLQKRLLALNQTKDFESPEFQALQGIITASFVARLGMPVDCWQKTVDAGINGETATALSGQTDFFLPSGSVSNWSVLPKLHRISQLPVLLNYGGHDMVRPQLIADTALDLDKVECNMLARAGHSVLLDAPSECYPIIRDFLMRLEDSIARKRPFRPSTEAVCPGKDTPFDRESSEATVSRKSFVLTLVIAIALSFGLGSWIGRRRGRKHSGYEAVGLALT